MASGTPPLPPVPSPRVPLPPGAARVRGVLVDWYQLRTRADAESVRYAVSEAFFSDGLSCPVEFHRESGRGGFKWWDVLTMGDVRLGHVAWGGGSVSGWAHLVLTGVGCGMVKDWDAFDASIRATLPDAEFKRVDLALDVFDGSITYEHVEAVWDVGGYDPVRGPRPARNRQGYPESGRTFYVGTRQTSDRFIRAYEKGIEKGYHPWGPDVPLDAWFRLEVELKPCNGPIPLDVIKAREGFFAGACPFFAQVLAGVEGRRAPRDPLQDMAAEVAEAVRHLRRSAGPSLRVLVDVYGSPEALVEALTSGVKPSERLVQAGALVLERGDLARFGV